MDDNLTVKKIFEALKVRYLDDSMYETNYSLLVSAVQRDGQSVKKYEYYLNEKVDLVNALAFDNNSKRISEELRLFHFVRGLHKSIKGRVLYAKPSTLTEADMKAKEAEIAFGGNYKKDTNRPFRGYQNRNHIKKHLGLNKIIKINLLVPTVVRMVTLKTAVTILFAFLRIAKRKTK